MKIFEKNLLAYTSRMDSIQLNLPATKIKFPFIETFKNFQINIGGYQKRFSKKLMDDSLLNMSGVVASIEVDKIIKGQVEDKSLGKFFSGKIKNALQFGDRLQ